MLNKSKRHEKILKKLIEILSYDTKYLIIKRYGYEWSTTHGLALILLHVRDATFILPNDLNYSV